MQKNSIALLATILVCVPLLINGSNQNGCTQMLIKQISHKIEKKGHFFKCLYNKSSLIKRMVQPDIENWPKNTTVQTIPNFLKAKQLWTKEAFGKTLMQYADTNDVLSTHTSFNLSQLNEDFRRLIISPKKLLTKELEQISLENLLGLFLLCRYLLISEDILRNLEKEIIKKTDLALMQDIHFFKTSLGRDLKRILKVHGFAKRKQVLPEPIINDCVIKNGEELVAFSPDGSVLAARTNHYCITIWNTQTDQVLYKLDSAKEILSMAFSPNNKYLALGLGEEGEVTIWDVSTGTLLQTISLNNAVTSVNVVISVAFTPDSTRLVTGSCSKVRIWDVQTGRLKHTIKDYGPLITLGGIVLQLVNSVESLAISPDGEYLATKSANGIVKIWNMRTGTLIHNLHNSDPVCSITFAPNGAYLATGTIANNIHLWDPRTATLLKTFHGNQAKSIESLAFSPDSTHLAAGAGDGTLSLWKVSTGELLHTLKHDGFITSLSFNPKSTQLAVASVESIKIVYLSEKLSLANLIMIKHLNTLKQQNKYIMLAQDKTIMQLIQGLSHQTRMYYLSNSTIFPIENQYKALFRKACKALGFLN